MKHKPFEKGNTHSRGRPKGSKNNATLLKNYLVNLLLNKKSELEKMNAKELLKNVSGLLPKEQTVHTDQAPIAINISKLTHTEPKQDKITIIEGVRGRGIGPVCADDKEEVSDPISLPQDSNPSTLQDYKDVEAEEVEDGDEAEKG